MTPRSPFRVLFSVSQIYRATVVLAFGSNAYTLFLLTENREYKYTPRPRGGGEEGNLLNLISNQGNAN